MDIIAEMKLEDMLRNVMKPIYGDATERALDQRAIRKLDSARKTADVLRAMWPEVQKAMATK